MIQLLLAALLVLSSTHAAFAQADERVIYASVVDQKGNPVSGLTARDFIVREDGQSREILRVEKDSDLLQIALLVDNSIEMRNRVSDLRRGLAAFVSAVRPGIEVALITTAERPTVLVPYTSDHAVLQKGIDRIVSLSAANYLLDGIAEASEGLAKRPKARSVIAVLTGRGPEYSFREYTDVLRIVKESRTPALHVTVLGGVDASVEIENRRADPMQGQRENSNPDRDLLLGRLTKDTGGRYEEVLATSALPMKMQQMAGELSNQYRVTYARPQRLIPPKKTDISARDPKLDVRGMLVE